MEDYNGHFIRQPLWPLANPYDYFLWDYIEDKCYAKNST